MLPFLRATSVCIAAAMLGACATGPLLPAGTTCEITSPRAPFYKYGPAQTFGADDMLAHGTRVTLVQRSMGFSRVMLGSGVTGYVSNDDLNPLAPEPPPKPGTVTNRKFDRVFTGPVKRSNVKPTPGDPLFDVNDVPLPTKEPTPQIPEMRVGPSEQPPAPEKKPE